MSDSSSCQRQPCWQCFLLALTASLFLLAGCSLSQMLVVGWSVLSCLQSPASELPKSWENFFHTGESPSWPTPELVFSSGMKMGWLNCWSGCNLAAAWASCTCRHLWPLSGCFDSSVLWLPHWICWCDNVSSGGKMHEVLWSFTPSPPFPVALQTHVFPAKLGAAEFQTAGYTETEPWRDRVTIQNQSSLNPQQSRWHLLLLGRLSEWQEEKENSQGKSRELSFLFGFFQAGMWV